MAASNHGNTPAAWTGVTIAFVGFVAGGYFTVKAQPVLVAASLVVVLLGGVVGLVMRAMGLGQPPHRADLYARAAKADSRRRVATGEGSDAGEDAGEKSEKSDAGTGPAPSDPERKTVTAG